MYLVLLEENLVGRINLSEIHRGVYQSASLGYRIGQEFCHMGIGTNAVASLQVQAHRRHRLHRLDAKTLANNLASQKVLLNNGFRLISKSQKSYRYSGRWLDQLMFECLLELNE